MIDKATVDRIMDAAQIVDVVSDFVTLRKAGVNYKGLCPFHDDRTPSFVVSPSKGLCKCFACGKGGNAVHFIMEHEQLSYPDALRYLARKYNIEIKERELTDEEKQAQDERESMFIVNEWACTFFQDQLYNTVDGRAIGMAYFRSRGFRDDIIKKFQLGYSQSQKDACAREAKAKGYKEEFLLSTGLCYKRENGQLQDRFYGRVIFPVHTLSGKVVAFGGRVLDAATKGVNVKYQNSPESAIYSKKKELYGLYLAKQAIVKHDLCFLVEGYTDVISMHQMGVENVVSSSGTALTSEQIRMIHRFTDNITVLYDGDAAGIKASERGIDMLLAEGMNVKLLLLPDGDDPDSFARKHNATEYQAYLNEHQVDFIKYKTDLLLHEAQGDPIKLSRLINSIVHSISVIPDNITRSVYTKETAGMLNMEERTLVAAISSDIAKAKEEKQKQRENERNRKNAQADGASQPPTPDQSRQPMPSESAPTPESHLQPPTPDENPGMTLPTAEQSTPPSTSASATQASALTYIPGTGTEEMLFYRKEQLLVQVLIRYGEKTMCYTEDEHGNDVPVSVAEFIHYALQEDNLLFHNPLHKRILQEAMDHIHEKGFVAERYFLNHPDNAVSMQAFGLSEDQVPLSKYHSKYQKIASDEDRLADLVPHLISDFKLAIVDEDLKQILLKLRQPDMQTRPEEYMSIMKHYKEMKDIECTLAKERGDRVIT
ncbi:MAG: DNA primase [Paraprevotella sp.]|nr:DNA primase [Paraprevotella sp.]